MQLQKEKRNGAEMLSEYALSRLTYNCIWSAKKKRRKRKRRERERKKKLYILETESFNQDEKKKKVRDASRSGKKRNQKTRQGYRPFVSHVCN